MNQPIIFLSPCRRSIQFSRADHQTRLPPGSRSPDLARPDQTRPDQVFRTDHLKRPASSGFLPQTTQPDQLPVTDHPARPASSHEHPASTGQDAIVRYLSQVTSILCGLGHGRLIYKALDEPCKAYFSHTFGLKSLDFLFRLYLIVVRVASGVPWAVKRLPYPFLISGMLCRYLVSDRSSAFQKQFRPRLDVCSSFRRFNFVVSPSSMSSSSIQSPAQLRQIRPISLLHFTCQSMRWASKAFTR